MSRTTRPRPSTEHRRWWRLALGLALLSAACSGGGADGESGSERATTSASSTTTTTRPPSEPPDVDVVGPVPGTPQTSGAARLEGTGFTETEWFVTGTATSFAAEGELGPDGRWEVTPADEAPYTTRILVKAPPADEFSGVAVVEWHNVSAGFDNAPDWSYAAEELLREGHVHVGVSAQQAGVQGDGEGLIGALGAPLRTADAERYAALDHPGDAFSYDLFTQVGELLRAPPEGPDPLQGLRPEHLIAAGESQSAFRLTTYLNAIHPDALVYDGFLVHSRGGGHAGLDEPDGVGSALTGGVRIRDDLDEPVFVVAAETDLTLLGYAAARQPDTDRLRTWELAGTAHADAHLLGGDPVAAADLLGCDVPVNDGPHHLALKAALAHLVDWVADPDDAPPAGEPLELTADGEIARADDGLALGGVRLPTVEVPVAVLSGDPVGGSVICRLFGHTIPFSPDELARRYGDEAGWLDRLEAAYDEAVDDGLVRQGDVADALADAAEVDFG